ncbi:unnamed protein product [Vitrella brassicaformis CCMP3155]|uniref:SP-RING-type domain-containing protein n=2 Tax=Vitrella brassicaformis TaxID=1169539 RepID=A0A0G4ER79_VITBC|nr:unnamed protein product [Vitrella brassicaformis CCMP3155]|eukprot:CEM00753.1 unnamed protein product [Vitrella brassicaformis CCMP3155]
MGDVAHFNADDALNDLQKTADQCNAELQMLAKKVIEQDVMIDATKAALKRLAARLTRLGVRQGAGGNENDHAYVKGMNELLEGRQDDPMGEDADVFVDVAEFADKCPITQEPFEHPVHQVVPPNAPVPAHPPCTHTFERHAILQLFATSPRIECPVHGCSRWVIRAFLRDNELLKRHLQAQREEGAAGGGGGAAAAAAAAAAGGDGDGHGGDGDEMDFTGQDDEQRQDGMKEEDEWKTPRSREVKREEPDDVDVDMAG